MIQPTGSDLIHQLWLAASARGVTLGEFARPLSSQPAKFLKQLRAARNPGPLTIERIRALIAGEDLPPPASRAFGGATKPAAEQVRDDLDWRRAIAEAAAERRLPGETLYSAVYRLERELRAA